MKKITILSKLKVWQEYCQTFSCRFKAGFSDFFETSRSTKRLVFYVTLLLLGLGFTTNTYGQLVGSSAVKANFGIDGDVYSDLLQFSNIATPPIGLPSAVATDDWFQTSYPGPGFGVIDQSALTPAEAATNVAFTRRLSITTPTAPFPFPLVPSGAINPADRVPYLWLDAVYGRDTYAKGGDGEKSYFAGGSDKNAANPSTWTIGTAGSVPAKDDIIDVYAHLRGEGPKAPTAQDPRPFTTLYAYAAASLVVTNGNKHLDFEFFRTALETPADFSVPGKTGPDGGRTAFTFYPSTTAEHKIGEVDVPGTIIISVDYTNGGNVPQVRIRVWMDEAVFNSYDNSNPFRPFTVDKNTAFEKGEGSGTFGYAAILENVGSTNIWGRVNINAQTLGPPWGTLEGSGPDFKTDYQPLQFVEIGINLTAFGLDKRGEQSPCSNLLGSLLVKTRSSGGGPDNTAFGSELKDFAGPFLFGNTGTPPVVTVPNKIVCEIAATGFATVDLTAGATTNPAGGAIQYFLNSDYTGEITSPTTYSAAIGTKTIYTRTESQTNLGCFGYGTFTVTVNANATANAGPDEVKCQTAPSGPTSFTLAGTATNGTAAWSVFASTGTAVATINSTGSLTSTVSVAGIGTVTLRLTTTSDATPSCGTATDDVVLTVNPNPTANAGPDEVKCQTKPSGPTSFTLAGTATNGTAAWSVFASTGSAVATINSTGSLTSTVSVAGIGTVTLRLTTTSNTTPSCGTATDDVVLTVNPNPTAAAGPDQVKCQTAPSGPTSFTLAGAATNGTPAWSVFTSTGTAVATINSTSSLTSTVSVAGIGTVTLRLTTTSNTTPSCGTATDDVVLTVNTNPTANAGPDEVKCQTKPSGPTSFTLAGTATNGTPTWSAIAATGTAVATINNTSSLTSTVSVAGIGTVTLRLTTTSDATPSCGTATDDVVLTVNPNPTANAGPDEVKCQTKPSGPTSFTLAGTATNGTAAWSVFASTGSAVATINSTGSLTSTVSVAGTGTVTLRLTTTSNTTPSCGTATDDVVLTVNTNPTANAGPDEVKCQTKPSGPTSFTLAGTATNGTPTWSAIAATGTAVATINNTSSLTSTVSVAGIGTVTLRLTTNSNATPSCGTATDDVVLTVNPNPTANAGPDEVKCQTKPSGPTSFTLAGTAANGTAVWSAIASTGSAVATINSTGSLTSTVSVAGTGTVTLRLTTTSNTTPSCGTATDDVVLTVNANPTADAGPDQTLCQTPPSGPTLFTLAGSASNGTPVWSIFASTGTAVATINNPGSLTSTVSVVGIGTVTVRLTTTSDATPSCGTAADDDVLLVNANPTVNAGPDEVKCQTKPSGPTSFTLAGTAANGTAVWSAIASTGTAVATINSTSSLTSTVSVAGIGTVTLRLTNTSNVTPSCGNATDDVVLTVNANPTVNAGPDETKCQTAPSGPTSFTLAGTATNGTPTWSAIAATGTAVATINNTSSLTSTVSVAGIGTVTLRLTNTSNATPSCGTVTDDVVLGVNANPTANAGPDQAKCQTAPSGPTAFTLAGTAANGTSVWSMFASTGTAVATINSTGSLTSTVSVAGTGTVTLRLTTTSNTTPSCGTATDDVVLTVNPLPICAITGNQTICAGDSSTFTATAGMTTYAWTGPGGFTAATQAITVSVAGIYNVTITNANGCISSCSRELIVESCAAALCTYTQGAYGNSGGKYCDGTVGGISTTNLIAQALANAGNSITVGLTGHSVIMNSGDEACIINVMPGGGKASELPAGDIGICSLTNPYLKNGRINNILLSQTIAMALNINITKPSDLGGLILQAGTLATAKPAGGCGSDIPKTRVCGYYEGDIWIKTVNEYTYRTFSAAVIGAITADGNGKKTVAGLLDLANRALANDDGIKNSEGGASLSDIAGAVGSINEVFDECAIFIGWDVSKCSPEPVVSSTTSKIELAGFTASPVPFRDVLKIKYNFDYVSNVKIEVFNPQGKVVLTKLDTNSYLNKEISLTLSSNIEQEQVYIVKLTTDRGSSTKKVMSSR